MSAVARGANDFPLFKDVYEWYQEIFPNFPKQCPIIKGKHYQSNVKLVYVYTTENMIIRKTVD